MADAERAFVVASRAFHEPVIEARARVVVPHADGDDGASHVDDDGRVTWQRGEARVRESAREVCAHRRVGEGFERASRTVRGGTVAKLAVAIVAPALE